MLPKTRTWKSWYMSNSKCFVGSIPFFSALPTGENSRRLALRNRTGLESPWPTSQVGISPSCCHVVNPIGPIWGMISSTPTHKEMVICWDHMGLLGGWMGAICQALNHLVGICDQSYDDKPPDAFRIFSPHLAVVQKNIKNTSHTLRSTG